METWLATSPWPGVILWVMLYTSDYYLTIYSARGFREIGHFQFEGSFELTPQYQKDIDALKPVSRPHLILLVLYSLLIILIWWFTRYFVYLEWAYLLYLGMFLLLEAAVHLRHLRNVALKREVRKSGGVEGQPSHRRWFSYRISAFEFYMYSVPFLMVAVLRYSLFFSGGAIMCLGTGFKHNRMVKKPKSKSPQSVAAEI